MCLRGPRLHHLHRLLPICRRAVCYLFRWILIWQCQFKSCIPWCAIKSMLMLLMLCKLQMVLASNRHKKAFLKVSGSVLTTPLVVYLLKDVCLRQSGPYSGPRLPIWLKVFFDRWSFRCCRPKPYRSPYLSWGSMRYLGLHKCTGAPLKICGGDVLTFGCVCVATGFIIFTVCCLLSRCPLPPSSQVPKFAAEEALNPPTPPKTSQPP